MEWLLDLDQSLFHLMNGTWRADWLDRLMPVLRDANTWYPFYLLLIIWIVGKLGKRGIVPVLVIAATVGVGDFTSSKIIKPTVERLRPCNDAAVPEVLIVNCGSGYSFTSSHATNHFALAVAVILICGGLFGKVGSILLLIWAASIAYAQVYVGVHYPIDVISGALLGTGLATLGAGLWRKFSPDWQRPL